MSANGTSSRKWANGPSVPLTTPFRDDESIDHDALAKQVVRLAKAGEGIVLLGTNGEGECGDDQSDRTLTRQLRTSLNLSEKPLLLPHERLWTAMASKTSLFLSELEVRGATHCDWFMLIARRIRCYHY